MYKFKIKEETIHNPEIGTYIAFGVEVYDKLSHNLIFEISDVFTNSAKAREFAFLCNLYQPEPVHLPQIISDFIQ